MVLVGDGRFRKWRGEKSFALLVGPSAGADHTMISAAGPSTIDDRPATSAALRTMSRATSPTHPSHALVWGLGSGLHLRPLLERFARVTVYPLDVDPADAAAAHERLTKDINLLRAISEN